MNSILTAINSEHNYVITLNFETQWLAETFHSRFLHICSAVRCVVCFLHVIVWFLQRCAVCVVCFLHVIVWFLQRCVWFVVCICYFSLRVPTFFRYIMGKFWGRNNVLYMSQTSPKVNSKYQLDLDKNTDIWPNLAAIRNWPLVMFETCIIHYSYPKFCPFSKNISENILLFPQFVFFEVLKQNKYLGGHFMWHWEVTAGVMFINIFVMFFRVSDTKTLTSRSHIHMGTYSPKLVALLVKPDLRINLLN